MFSNDLAEEFRLPTYQVKGKEAAKEAEKGNELPRCAVPAARAQRQARMTHAEVMAKIFRLFMRRHSGVSVIIAGIGHREAVPWPASARRYVSLQPHWHSTTHDCAVAVLLNAVLSLVGEEASECLRFLLEKRKEIFLNLCHMRPLLDAAKVGYPIVRSFQVHFPDLSTKKSASCDIRFVSPSASICELWTNPISVMTPSQKPLRAAEMSSIIRSSEVRNPLEIT